MEQINQITKMFKFFISNFAGACSPVCNLASMVATIFNEAVVKKFDKTENKEQKKQDV